MRKAQPNPTKEKTGPKPKVSIVDSRFSLKREYAKVLPQPYTLKFLPHINKIQVKSDPYLYPAIRCFSGVIEHNPYAGTWFSVPATKQNILFLEALATPDSVDEVYKEYRNNLMSIDVTWAQQAEEWSKTDRKMLPHQLQFLQLAYNKRGMFNGSEQGTGKTTPAFILSHSLGARKVLVVCPKSLPGEWIREQNKLWNDKQPFEIVDCVNDTIANRKRMLEEYLLNTVLSPKNGIICLVNYEALNDLLEYLCVWEPHITWYDESWRIKNPSAKTTQAAMMLSEFSKQNFPLGGTVIGNDIGDLWSQIYIINKDLLGGMSHYDFLQRYATFRPVNTAQGARMVPVGVSDPVGLMTLLESIWFRAIKATCTNLPPKEYEEIKIKLHSETKQLYKEVKENGLSALGVAMSLEGDRVVRLRLHQIAGGFKPVPAEDKEKWNVEPLPCAKLDWLNEWAKDHIPTDGETRCIVWVRFNAEGKRIKTALEKIYGENGVVFAYADTKQDELEKWKDDFNSRNPKGIKFFICQTQKMCNGHNLPAGDHLIFFSNTYSYIYRSQAEERSDRVDRVSQQGIKIWDLIAEGTIDKEIYDTLKRKESLSKRFTPSTASDTIGEQEEEEEKDLEIKIENQLMDIKEIEIEYEDFYDDEE